MNPKIKESITIFLLQLVLTLPFFTANAYGLAISDIKVAKVTANSATIEWTTDAASSGKVMYGNSTSLGFTQRHDNFMTNHSLYLSNGIFSETNYFFAVESTGANSTSIADNNSNNFYTFKTSDITPPQQVTGLKAGATTSDSIFLSWNNAAAPDLDHYVVYRNLVPIANSTTNSFNDTGLETDKNFNYKVSAVDKSNNEGAQSAVITASTAPIDSTEPVITSLDVSQITDTTATLKWVTNENSTTIALYGVNVTDKTKS